MKNTDSSPKLPNKQGRPRKFSGDKLIQIAGYLHPYQYRWLLQKAAQMSTNELLAGLADALRAAIDLAIESERRAPIEESQPPSKPKARFTSP